MRILVVMSGTTMLGRDLVAEPNIKALEALAARGHSVTCIAPTSTTSLNRRPRAKSFVLQTVLFRKNTPIIPLLIFQLRATWRVLRSIDRYDTIIMHVYTVPFVFPIIVIANAWSRLPTFILKIPTSPVDTGWALRTIMMQGIYNLSLRLAALVFNKILFTSPMMEALYSKELHIPRNKVGVWPASFDLELFAPLHANANQVRNLRKRLKLSNRLTVLYLGTLKTSRGLIELIEAFAILKKSSFKKAKLILLGDGPDKESARKYVSANNLEDDVLFCGPVKQSKVPVYISACDVGISPLPDHPWWRYQSPTKVLEYLAMKKPVIVSDIPAHRWIIGRAPVAVFLRETTARGIADGIITFADGHKKLHSEVGRRISAQFSTENTAKMLESEIQRRNAGSVMLAVP